MEKTYSVVKSFLPDEVVQLVDSVMPVNDGAIYREFGFYLGKAAFSAQAGNPTLYKQNINRATILLATQFDRNHPTRASLEQALKITTTHAISHLSKKQRRVN